MVGLYVKIMWKSLHSSIRVQRACCVNVRCFDENSTPSWCWPYNLSIESIVALLLIFLLFIRKKSFFFGLTITAIISSLFGNSMFPEGGRLWHIFCPLRWSHWRKSPMEILLLWTWINCSQWIGMIIRILKCKIKIGVIDHCSSVALKDLTQKGIFFLINLAFFALLI